MAAPIRHASSAKTHCPRGHEYNEENTKLYQGRRFCRQCDRDRRKTPDGKKKKQDADAKYYAANKTELAKKAKPRNQRYYEAHKEEYFARAKKYYWQNPEKFRQKAKQFREDHREDFLAYMRSPERREYLRSWTAEKYKNDPQFNIVRKVRHRIWSALQTRHGAIAKSDKTIHLLGCTYTELKVHIESQFADGMTWDKCFNGEIHLDHIRPLASYNLIDPEEQKKAFHYTNLQPLWATENLKKHAKWEPELQVA